MEDLLLCHGLQPDDRPHHALTDQSRVHGGAFDYSGREVVSVAFTPAEDSRPSQGLYECVGVSSTEQGAYLNGRISRIPDTQGSKGLDEAIPKLWIDTRLDQHTIDRSTG